MNILMYSLIYSIIILFPILLNLFFIVYKKSIKKKESHAYLNLALVLSLYLSIKYFEILNINYFYIFSTIPIFLAFVYKKPIFSSILIIIYAENYLMILNNNFIYIIILVFIYFILYLFYITTNMTKKNYCFYFSLSNITINIVILYNYNIDISFNNILIFIYYFLFIYLSIIFIIASKKIIQLFMSFKEIEKEKFIKVSLFKLTHEIKNPLTVVKGYLDMFDANNTEKSEKYLAIIKSEIKRTLNLLSDFNDFNKIKINKVKTNLNTLLYEINDIFTPYFKENNALCSFKIQNDITISLDQERIKQVLINILKNSIEANKYKCIINLTAYINADKLYIYIKDNSGGMSKEILDNLFTPFYTTKDYGTGLGLPLSKEIIEAHNGSISYTSIINKGTTVKIILPIN